MNFSLFYSFIYVGKIQFNDNKIKVIKITTDVKEINSTFKPKFSF